MPANQQRKERTKAEIVEAAGAVFREHGYLGATIDDIMAAVGLTRGTFYAHFGSKEALFSEVVATKHDLLRRLQERDDSTPADLRAAAASILRSYVDPANQAAVGPNCTLSTLAADVARSKPESRAAFGELLEVFGEEIGRGYGPSEVPAFATLSMLVGAVLLAHGCQGSETQNKILRESQACIARLRAR